MAKNIKKTAKLFVDEVDSDKNYIEIKKRVKGSEGIDDDDFVIKGQILDPDDDIRFTGEVEFTRPISVRTKFMLLADISQFPIAWQTDLVPGTDKTYVQTFGNTLFKAVVVGDDGSGFQVPFDADLKYNTNPDGTINEVLVENFLYATKITFF